MIRRLLDLVLLRDCSCDDCRYLDVVEQVTPALILDALLLDAEPLDTIARATLVVEACSVAVDEARRRQSAEVERVEVEALRALYDSPSFGE